jgi:HSP20 family protein
MTDITIRKDEKNLPAPMRTEPRWEPLRLMRELMNWDPFREMSPYNAPQWAGAFSPSFEIKETKDGYLFKADVPGIKQNDLDITVTGNRLTIAGKREAERQEQSDTYYAYECSYGSFTRSFTLPEGVDTNSVSADLKDGVLAVRLKKTPEAQPKRVSVKAQEESTSKKS